jgi:hypothetical protein
MYAAIICTRPSRKRAFLRGLPESHPQSDAFRVHPLPDDADEVDASRCVRDDARMSAPDELASLRARRDELQKEVHDLDGALTFANVDVEHARAALAEAERKRLGGNATAQDVSAAEKRLAAAKKAATADVSVERLQGARSALRDHDNLISAYAREHYDELRAAHDEQAIAAGEAIDDALQALIAAFEHRQRVEGAAADLWRLVAPPRRGLTPPSRAQQAVTAAETSLMAGNDPPPVLPPSYLPDRAEEPVMIPPIPTPGAF